MIFTLNERSLSNFFFELHFILTINHICALESLQYLYTYGQCVVLRVTILTLLTILTILILTPFQISDYTNRFRQCTIEDQSLLSIFHIDTGPYQRYHFGYRKRTAPVKLVVVLPLVEERQDHLVRNYF